MSDPSLTARQGERQVSEVLPGTSQRAPSAHGSVFIVSVLRGVEQSRKGQQLSFAPDLQITLLGPLLPRPVPCTVSLYRDHCGVQAQTTRGSGGDALPGGGPLQ